MKFQVLNTLEKTSSKKKKKGSAITEGSTGADSFDPFVPYDVIQMNLNVQKM